MQIEDILKEHGKCVVIVHYRIGSPALYNEGHAPQNPACLLQVTLDPDKISPSGRLIRLGDTNGDEIIGWTKLAALNVVEILGTTDGKIVKPIITNAPKLVEWPPAWSLEAQPQEAA